MAQFIPAVSKLKGKVQHYAWGGYEFIPQLLGLQNETHQPYAEYWMGAHPNHSSEIAVEESWVSLQQFIKENTSAILGEETSAAFGALPYLFKVLDVRQMLSIQVHPDKESAKQNYQKENEAGIPVTAPHRNYKDENHKPELMVALSDFWLLHGFKSPSLLKETLAAIPDFTFLIPIFEQGGYQALYEKVMRMKQEEVNRILEPVINRIIPIYKNGELKKKQEDFWAARAVETFCKDDNYDRGIFSIYFFNLVNLKKGEGIYQPAGLPHAYLEGQNVELMANSDNVLRAGLTDKHIDVPELMKYVQFEETIPSILGTSAQQKEVPFITPAPEFEMTRYQLSERDTVSYQTYSAEIILVLAGSLQITAAQEQIRVQKGETAFIISGSQVDITVTATADFFRAAVPVRKN